MHEKGCRWNRQSFEIESRREEADKLDCIEGRGQGKTRSTAKIQEKRCDFSFPE